MIELPGRRCVRALASGSSTEFCSLNLEFCILYPLPLYFFSHLLLDPFGDKARDRASQFEYFFDEPGTEIRICLCRHQENGFNLWLKPTIHQRHLQLVFVIADGADASDNHLRLLVEGIIDEQ